MPRRLLDPYLLFQRELLRRCLHARGKDALCQSATPVEMGLSKKPGVIFLHPLAKSSARLRIQIERLSCRAHQPGSAEYIHQFLSSFWHLQSEEAQMCRIQGANPLKEPLLGDLRLLAGGPVRHHFAMTKHAFDPVRASRGRCRVEKFSF